MSLLSNKRSCPSDPINLRNADPTLQSESAETNERFSSVRFALMNLPLANLNSWRSLLQIREFSQKGLWWFSIMHFAVQHIENLRAAIISEDDSEPMAIGYTVVKVIQLPLFTLSSERNYSNLVIQDNIIQLTGGLGTVYTPQNGTCAPLSGARKRYSSQELPKDL